MLFEGLAAVLHVQGADSKTANVTCQTATTFSVPSPPLQYEVLIILLGDPQFKRVFQQNLFGFEPHVSNVTELSVKSSWHVTVVYNEAPAANPWTFVCVRIPPFPRRQEMLPAPQGIVGVVVYDAKAFHS